MKRERPDQVRQSSIAKESRSHTVNDNITHSISPVLLLLVLPIITPQLSSEMPKDGIALRQDPPVQFNDGDVGRRVHLRDASLLILWVLFEAIARVVVGDAGIFPYETNDLPATSGLEIEVMDVWDASDGFVGGRLCATTLGGRHFEGVQLVSYRRGW